LTRRRLNGNHQSDPKAPCRVRLQIGTVSGIKLECLSGFASEYPSGFIGIRTPHHAKDGKEWISLTSFRVRL
jgi:hypothetical protein